MTAKRMSPRWRRPMAVTAVAATIASALVAAAAATALAGTTPVRRPAPSAANPTATGPVTGGKGAIVLPGTTTFNLSSVGYTQSEFFISGRASSYAPKAPLGSGGRWQVAPATTAPYATRIVVYRPADPARFNGTVVVEWLNVSAGVAAVKAADPVRYAALSHPGVSYSYDIFSQAGQAVRDEAATILGGLRPRRVLAEGESQSATRLTTYIDAIQPLVHEYDGFLVHSRFAGSAALSQSPQANIPTPQLVYFRPDRPVQRGQARGPVPDALAVRPAVGRPHHR